MRFLLRLGTVCVGGLLAFSLMGGTPKQRQQHASTFTEVTEEAGIRFKHSYGDYRLSNIDRRNRGPVLGALTMTGTVGSIFTF